MAPTDRSGGSPSVGGIMLFFALFVVVGGPLVFVIWETINQLLTGNVAGVRWQWFVPAVVGFGALLVVLGRMLRHWSADG